MQALDYWRLNKRLSVVQAALLIVGVDPARAKDGLVHPEPEGYAAVFAALQDAILSGDLKAVVRRPSEALGWIDAWIEDAGEDTEMTFDQEEWKTLRRVKPDWTATMVEVPALREWLTRREFASDFFTSPVAQSAAYRDSSNPCYSPRLVAAVDVWNALRGKALGAKSVKEAAIDWLTKHAKKYELVTRAGEPSKNGIEAIAKVVNWKPEGGAPSTPE